MSRNLVWSEIMISLGFVTVFVLLLNGLCIGYNLVFACLTYHQVRREMLVAGQDA